MNCFKLRYAMLVPVILGSVAAEAHLEPDWSADFSIGAFTNAKFVTNFQRSTIVAGQSQSSAIGHTASAWFLRKYEEDGDLEWSREFSGLEDKLNEIHAMKVDGSGNVIVSGYETHSGGERAVVRKYSPSGSLLWNRTFEGNVNKGNSFHDIAFDASGSIYLTGQATYASRGTDMAVVKYNSAGTRQYYKIWAGLFGSNESGKYIRIPQTGNYGFIAGARNGLKMGIYKFDMTTGRIMATNTYVTPTKDIVTGMELTTDGRIALVGTMAFNTNDSAAAYAAFDSNCRLVGARRFGSLTDKNMTDGLSVVTDGFGRSYAMYETYKKDGTLGATFAAAMESNSALIWSYRLPGAYVRGKHLAKSLGGSLLAVAGKGANSLTLSGVIVSLGMDGQLEEEFALEGTSMPTVHSDLSWDGTMMYVSQTPGVGQTAAVAGEAHQPIQMFAGGQVRPGDNTVYVLSLKPVQSNTTVNMTYPAGVTGPETVVLTPGESFSRTAATVTVSSEIIGSLTKVQASMNGENGALWFKVAP